MWLATQGQANQALGHWLVRWLLTLAANVHS